MHSTVDDARREAQRKSLLHPLQRLAGDFRQRVRAGLHSRGHALQPAHASVIVHLPIEGTRLTDLADRAGMSKQGMGKLVDELEAIGYLERTPDPQDGRAKHVRFSRAGLELLGDSRDIVDEIWEAYAEQIGEPRLRRMRDTLLGLLDALERGDPEAKRIDAS